MTAGPFWCSHGETIEDDEHQVICVRCGAAFYNGPLREQDIIDFADAVLHQAGCMTYTERRLADALDDA